MPGLSSYFIGTNSLLSFFHNRENGISNLEELLAYQAKRKNKDTKAKQNNIDVFDEVIADES